MVVEGIIGKKNVDDKPYIAVSDMRVEYDVHEIWDLAAEEVAYELLVPVWLVCDGFYFLQII